MKYLVLVLSVITVLLCTGKPAKAAFTRPLAVPAYQVVVLKEVKSTIYQVLAVFIRTMDPDVKMEMLDGNRLTVVLPFMVRVNSMTLTATVYGDRLSDTDRRVLHAAIIALASDAIVVVEDERRGNKYFTSIYVVVP